MNIRQAWLSERHLIRRSVQNALSSCTTLAIVIFLNTSISIADSAGSDHYSLKHIDLTEADNGSAIGVVVGTELNVFLKVSPKFLIKGVVIGQKQQFLAAERYKK